MSLVQIESLLLQTVLDALAAGPTNVDPAGVLVFRYLCAPPQDCCTDDGVLTASWGGPVSRGIFASKTGARQDAIGGEIPGDPGELYADVALRWWRCWPGLSGWKPTPPSVTEMDDAAVRLTDEAESVTFALLALICSGDLGCSARYTGTTAICPSGLCAGVQWNLTVLLGAPPVSVT